MTYTKMQKNQDWYHSCHESSVRKQCVRAGAVNKEYFDIKKTLIILGLIYFVLKRRRTFKGVVMEAGFRCIDLCKNTWKWVSMVNSHDRKCTFNLHLNLSIFHLSVPCLFFLPILLAPNTSSPDGIGSYSTIWVPATFFGKIFVLQI